MPNLEGSGLRAASTMLTERALSAHNRPQPVVKLVLCQERGAFVEHGNEAISLGPCTPYSRRTHLRPGKPRAWPASHAGAVRAGSAVPPRSGSPVRSLRALP
eukprot:1128633-Prymnesium_polylepis.1